MAETSRLARIFARVDTALKVAFGMGVDEVAVCNASFEVPEGLRSVKN